MHPKPTRSVIAIGETILIKDDGSALILTSGIQRKYSEISYSLSQSDEEGDQKMKGADDEERKSISSEDSANMGRNVEKGRIQSTRLRSKNLEQRVDNEQRKRSQEELHEKKIKELQQRFDRNEIQGSAKKEKVKKMDEIQSYSN